MPKANISIAEYDKYVPPKDRLPAGAASSLDITDEEIDKLLSTHIPGGSAARDWFLSHESEKSLNNVRSVVRRMINERQEQLLSKGILANSAIAPDQVENLCLVTLSPGGIMEQATQGVGPFEIEMIDCQNGEAGDTYEFDAKWEPLLIQYFGEKSKWPEYVRLTGDEIDKPGPAPSGG